MSMQDKIKNAAEQATGKIKESAGKATSDEEKEKEGRKDQGKASLKQAAEKAKDAFKS